jgi:hypothetical protein
MRKRLMWQRCPECGREVGDIGFGRSRRDHLLLFHSSSEEVDRFLAEQGDLLSPASASETPFDGGLSWVERLQAEDRRRALMPLSDFQPRQDLVDALPRFDDAWGDSPR